MNETPTYAQGTTNDFASEYSVSGWAKWIPPVT
jgi:hypothetical protein